MRRFYQGATIPLSFTHPDFPKAEWSAQLIFRAGSVAKTFDAAEDPDKEGFVITISATESALLEPSNYEIIYRYSNLDGDVAFVSGSEIVILPDPTAATDQRSQLELDLASVDAAIRAKIEGGAVEEYSIQTTVGQRSLKNMMLADLRNHRRWLVAQIDRERIKQGKKPLSRNRWHKISSHLGNQSNVPRRRY